jgi:hypothetical protein
MGRVVSLVLAGLVACALAEDFGILSIESPSDSVNGDMPGFGR